MVISFYIIGMCSALPYYITSLPGMLAKIYSHISDQISMQVSQF